MRFIMAWKLLQRRSHPTILCLRVKCASRCRDACFIRAPAPLLEGLFDSSVKKSITQIFLLYFFLAHTLAVWRSPRHRVCDPKHAAGDDRRLAARPVAPRRLPFSPGRGGSSHRSYPGRPRRPRRPHRPRPPRRRPPPRLPRRLRPRPPPLPGVRQGLLPVRHAPRRLPAVRDPLLSVREEEGLLCQVRGLAGWFEGLFKCCHLRSYVFLDVTKDF